MIRTINDLTGNSGRFARYCAEQYTIAELVAFIRSGVDYDTCEQWDITRQQWHEGILAALEDLREQT